MRVRKITFLLVTMLVLTAFCFFSIHVKPAQAADPTLTDIFNNLGFTNTVEIILETFPSGTYNITFYAEFAEHLVENELSYYQINTSTHNPIFTPAEGVLGYISPPITKTFSADYEFGLSLLSWNQTRYYSETAMNPDNQTHIKVYKNLNNPNMLLIGYDERSYCTTFGDQDFNDMVFSLQQQQYLRVISPYDTPKGEGWYYNGTTVFASLIDNIIDHGNGTRRVFNQWNSDAHGTNHSKSDPIYMNQNKTATASWKTQQYLTIRTDPNGIASISGQGWYDQGQPVQLTAPNVTGYAFSFWDIDGISQGSGINPITVNMNAPHTTTAHYLHQLTLTVETSAGGTTNPSPGSYNQNPGSNVQVTAVPAVNYALDYWLLDGANIGSANPYIVLMDKNHTLRAVFKSSPPITVSIDPMDKTISLGHSVQFTSTVSGGTGPYSYQWYLDNTPVPGATSSAWTFTPTATGTYYVKLKVTDTKGGTAESGVARVEVSPRPVGGYTVSMKGHTTTDSLASYVALLAASTIILTTVKRRRSR